MLTNDEDDNSSLVVDIFLMLAIKLYPDHEGMRVDHTLTGQLADEPTRSQSSRGLDNSRTGQLADNELQKNMELLSLFVH